MLILSTPASIFYEGSELNDAEALSISGAVALLLQFLASALCWLADSVFHYFHLQTHFASIEGASSCSLFLATVCVLSAGRAFRGMAK